MVTVILIIFTGLIAAFAMLDTGIGEGRFGPWLAVAAGLIALALSS